MENNYNNIEVILFSKYSLKDPHQKEPENWLATGLQFAIRKQHKKAKRMLLTILKNTPAIYMS